ncbi:DUF3613 domain-containing protein [Paraburkholderia ferrariae]|uniref:DUF3613 domain-containing protein n=1 Tax=Paraburkholderia ferrariae TaxID=386056 RepID=UPI0005A8E126|nr:DUF3613 domain-containing protein [Paraburkholderia ferrariae]
MNKTNENRGRGIRLVMQASLWLALSAAFAPLAHAQASEAVPNSEIGHTTLAWLDLQRSNVQAAPALPMLGAEAGYAWKRYLKSFDTVIPASFGSSVDSGSSGQSQGSSTASAGSN